MTIRCDTSDSILFSQIIYLHKSPEEAFAALNVGPPYAQYCDASYGTSNYTISLMHCFQAIYKASAAGFFDFNDFDPFEYVYYERVEYGDLNWIVPNKFIAFCGPHNRSKVDNGYPCHAPETYFNYFRQNNVRTVVRLNLKLYNASRFTCAGFDHRDLFFTDGSKPSDQILKSFLQICETSNGAVAVHCKGNISESKAFRWMRPERIKWHWTLNSWPWQNWQFNWCLHHETLSIHGAGDDCMASAM